MMKVTVMLQVNTGSARPLFNELPPIFKASDDILNAYISFFSLFFFLLFSDSMLMIDKHIRNREALVTNSKKEAFNE